MKKLCALVIGHKKKSSGARNIGANLTEFDFNEELARRIEVSTVETEIQRVYRRTYKTLPDDINELEPDFIVSLHCNAFDRKVSGTEVLYYYKSKKGKRLARILLRHLVNHLQLPNRGIKPKTTEDRGGYLLRYTKAPCVIGEPFFIDIDDDLARAQENLDGLSAAYANAIDEFSAEISTESPYDVPSITSQIDESEDETEDEPLTEIPAEIEKRYGGYNLKQGDQDNGFIYAGSSRFRDVGDIVPEQSTTPYVQQLQQDLMALGFRIVGEANGIFNLQTEWAVREFQIYAKMEYIAREDPEALGSYVNRLSQVKNELRYDGPISGVVNKKTRPILQHWLSNSWRCPLIVEAWNMVSGERSKVYKKNGEDGENIWLHDDITSNAPRMYVRDFSNYYNLPNTRNPDELIVLGDYVSYLNWGGPRSVPPRHTWFEAEMLPEGLVGVALDNLSGAQRSTYKVVRAVSEVECLGFFDSVNAYDNAFVSLGPCHWTLGIVKDNSVSEGELCGYLAYLSNADPGAFQKAIEFFGVRIDENWGTDGQSLFNKSQRKYAGWVALEQDDGNYARMDTEEYLGNYFKSWHWFYRFVMAGRTIEGFHRRMWDMARIRLRDLLATPWSIGAEVPGVSDGQGGTCPATIGDVYTSERALALILRWHIRFPAHVIRSGRVGSKLQNAFKRAMTHAPMGNPTEWADMDEMRLIEGIMDEVDDIGNQNLIDTMDTVHDWPIWANGRNPRRYKLDKNIGNLAVARNSFKFDDSALPPAPAYT